MSSELIIVIIATTGGLIGVVIGAIIAWWLPLRSSNHQRQVELEGEIVRSATVCLGRLFKMRLSLQAERNDMYESEKYLLGGDGDQFLRAIARRPGFAPSGYSLFKGISELLVEVVPRAEILNHIDELAEGLQAIVTNAGE